MALIQDIQPPKKSGMKPPSFQAVQQQVQAFHQATNLPRVAKSFDIIMPSKLRGQHLQRNLQQPLVRQPITTRSQPRQVLPKPPITRSPPTNKLEVPRSQALIGRRLLDFAQYPLIALVAVGAAYSSTLGQAMVGLYALISIILRLASQYTFGAALLLLISIPFFQIIHQSGVSQNAAIYAYELLVVGTLQAVVELLLANRGKERPKQPLSTDMSD